MKAYSFLLNFGYAENGMLSFVPFVSDKEFSSTKAAFTDLANFFKDAYMEQQPKPKKCCLAGIAAGGCDYCGKCGSSLKQEEFDDEAFIEFVDGIAHADNDRYHGEIVDYDQNARWQSQLPADLDKVKVIYVAEKCLAAALGYSPDDRVTIDTIFANHRKTDSFSFWD